MSGYRRPSGGKIVERGKTVTFSFDGKQHFGFAGDTLASALMASGVMLVGRSLKYHRPRGILAAGVEEPNALVTIMGPDGHRAPNVRATELEIYPGLACESQNRFPSLAFDAMAASGLAGSALAAGFAGKTFMGPTFGLMKATRPWMAYERRLRRLAGLGRLGTEPDRGRSQKMNAFCDLLVVGAGKPGIRAALEGADQGKQVIICDNGATLGGYANWSGDPDISAMVTRLQEMDNVRALTRTSVWGWYDGMTLAAAERLTDHLGEADATRPRQRHWVIRAGHVALATGALERPLVFADNDRPGVMLASAAQRYAAMYGVLPGKRIVLFTNNDSAYATAIALKARDANLVAIIDIRADVPEAAHSMAAVAGATLHTGHAVTGTSGGAALDSVSIAPYRLETRRTAGPGQDIACDCLLMSGGWSPVVHLPAQRGDAPVWDEHLQAFLPPPTDGNWSVHGAVAGDFEFGDGLSPAPAPVIEIGGHGKAFVDFQTDVTADDVRLARREGFHAAEHLKRYTGLGMGTDQGKTAGVAGMTIMAEALGTSVETVGTTRFRPPYAGVPIGTIAAERHGDLHPRRFTPMHDWHVKNGATMRSDGLWERSAAYRRWNEEAAQASLREARAARRSVGIADVTPRSTIDLRGPDAARLLDHVCANTIADLPIGRTRYTPLLREDGFIWADATVCRLTDHHFTVTARAGQPTPMLEHFEFFQHCGGTAPRVHLTCVSDQWATMALAGPRAPDVLSACVIDTDVDTRTLPAAGVVHGRIAGIAVMIARPDRPGPFGYEVRCAAGHGLDVWNALIAAGEPFDIAPIGLQAMETLRIEDGQLAASEIDGRTTAHDLNLDGFVSTTKPFVGSAMMDRLGLKHAGRHALVGVAAQKGGRLLGGSHLVASPDKQNPGASLGHLTAACFSPTLERHVALALLAEGRARIGQTLYATDPLRSGTHIAVDIVRLPFLDPAGGGGHG